MLREDGIEVFWGQNHMLPVGPLGSCLRLLTIHDLTAVVAPHTMPLRARFAARTYFASAALAADRVLAVSESSARLTQRYLRVPAAKLRVLYQGLSPAFERPATDGDSTDIPRKYGIPHPYLLTVGTIEPRKDYTTLLRALELRPAPLLVIVGNPGWKCRSVLRQIRRLEAAGRVRYLGAVPDDDLASLYRGAVLTVCASVYEGFGLPIAEAMSCGCPVLCSWTSSFPEVGGPAACYFRVRDPQDLAAKLHRLLSDSQQLEAMARAGHEQAARFSSRLAADQLVDEIQNLVRRHHGA